MTLNELQNEVLALIFEPEFDSQAAFISAVNRALSTVHTERKKCEVLDIYKEKPHPSGYIAKLRHKANEALTLATDAKSASFTVSGTGKVLFTFKTYEKEREFSGITVIKMLLDEECEISFLGEYDYEIYDLAFFDSVRSDNEEDVEVVKTYKEYDMKKLDTRFLAFSSLPENEAGEAIRDSVCEGCILKIPFDYEGKISISYKRSFSPVIPGDVDREIDVAAECAHLVPLLTAAYLLADDNERLSQYYMSLYRDGMASVSVYNRTKLSSKYTDVLGWCK